VKQHWLVVGASSAIARAFVREAARRGALLTLAGRDPQDLEASAGDARLRGAAGVRVLRCDVTDADSRAACIAAAGVPDAVLNVLLAAGQMPAQGEMEADPELLLRMADATYAGPLALLQGLVPLFERQRGGRIVIVGSVAGDRGRRKNYLYGSAKAGLATFAEGLRARLFRAGSTVTLVKPGFVDTAMTWGLPGLFLVGSPEACAAAAMRAAERGRACLYYPPFWRLVMLAIRCLPGAIMKRLGF
jgi:NAD(P)-dependent dehydrogenase (short-subunit alcohol dehydrogenase family)